MKARSPQLGENDYRLNTIVDSNCMICLVALILIILGISLAIMFSYST